MNYIAPRNMTVSSTSGRSVEFTKATATYAPPQMHAELIARGIVPAEEVPEPVVDANSEPTIASEREAALYAAFEAIILRGKRGDFAGTGVPHGSVLAKEMGWSSVDGKERDATWQKFQATKAA